MFHIKYTAVFAASALALSSCADMGGLMVSTPDEVKTMRQARITHTAGGAALGAAAGYLIGQQSGNGLMGGIIGGLAGGAIGNQTGTKAGANTIMAKRTAKATEEQLSADIASAKKFNSAAMAYNSRLRKEIAELKKTKSKAESVRLQRQAQLALNEYNTQLETMSEYIANDSNSAGKSRMTSQQSVLKSRKSELERQIAQVKAVKTLEMQ